MISAVAFVALTGLVDWAGRQAIPSSSCTDGGTATAAPPETEGELVDLIAEPVADGLDEPIDIFTLSGHPGIFVVEKPGRVVRVVDGKVMTPPVLDMRALVLADSNEQGLLSVRPDPDFASNCRVYVFYTDSYGDSRLVSASVSGSAEPTIDVRSFHPLLEIPQRHRWHQSGTMTFGPDGFLWLAIGDGGGTGDPDGHGQNPSTLKGTVVRIDVDSSSYVVPESNPFAASEEGRPEVWAYGLRNPWRISIDATTGTLFIPDVGQEETEEINVVDLDEGGLNFGWAITEGSNCYDATTCDSSGLTPPTYEYDHDGMGCAVVGGQVYRGAAIPEIAGHYFFSDFCSGWVRSLELRDGAVAGEHEWEGLRVSRLITSFGTDALGELYFMSLDGGLWKIAALR